MMSRKAYKTTKAAGEQHERQDQRPMFHSESLPGQQVESSIIGERIDEALDVLTPQERSVFVLRHYQDLPLIEVADILNMKHGTVRSVLFRALKRLQKELKEYGPDQGREAAS